MRTKAENRDGSLGFAEPLAVSGLPQLGDPLSIGLLVALVVADAGVRRHERLTEETQRPALPSDRLR